MPCHVYGSHTRAHRYATWCGRQAKTGGHDAYSTGRNLNIIVCICGKNNIMIKVNYLRCVLKRIVYNPSGAVPPRTPRRRGVRAAGRGGAGRVPPPRAPAARRVSKSTVIDPMGSAFGPLSILFMASISLRHVVNSGTKHEQHLKEPCTNPSRGQRRLPPPRPPVPVCVCVCRGRAAVTRRTEQDIAAVRLRGH